MPPRNFAELVSLIVGYIKDLLPILAGVALLVFFYGLMKFMYKAGDAKSHEEGRRLMVYGVIGLFVLFSFMGIIYFFSRDLGFSFPTRLPTLPQ